MSNANTFLFVWNPKMFDWKDIQESIDQIRDSGVHIRQWSCGNTTKIRKGDRFFLIRVGEEPKGIVGSGYIKREKYTEYGQNWVTLAFNTILDATSEQILEIKDLQKAGPKQHWTPQGSGISIRPEYVGRLEELWLNITKYNN